MKNHELLSIMNAVGIFSEGRTLYVEIVNGYASMSSSCYLLVTYGERHHENTYPGLALGHLKVLQGTVVQLLMHELVPISLAGQSVFLSSSAASALSSRLCSISIVASAAAAVNTHRRPRALLHPNHLRQYW